MVSGTSDVTFSILNRAHVVSNFSSDHLGDLILGSRDLDLEVEGLDPSAGASDSVTVTATIDRPNPFRTVAEVCDANDTCIENSAEFSIDGAPNTTPSALDDTATVHVNDQFTFSVAGNDADADGHGLEVTGITATSCGSVTNFGGSNLTFQAPGSTGPCTVDYEVTDDYGATASATLTVNVSPAGQVVPTAMGEHFTICQNQGMFFTPDLVGNDLDADGDSPLTLDAITSPPSHGNAVVNGNNIEYTVTDMGFFGIDTLTYRIKEPAGAGSKTATTQVRFAIKECN